MKGKVKSMVAEAPKKMGRPRKFVGEDPLRLQILIPGDLRRAAEQHRQDRKLSSIHDALRDLVREAAERRQLVDARR